MQEPTSRRSTAGGSALTTRWRDCGQCPRRWAASAPSSTPSSSTCSCWRDRPWCPRSMPWSGETLPWEFPNVDIIVPGWTASTVSATLWSLSTSGLSSCQMIQQFLRELLTKSWWEMKMVVHETISIFAGMLDNVHTAHPADCWHGNTYRQHWQHVNTFTLP